MLSFDCQSTRAPGGEEELGRRAAFSEERAAIPAVVGRPRNSIGIVSSCLNRTVNVEVEYRSDNLHTPKHISNLTQPATQQTGGANVAKVFLARATEKIGKRVAPQLLDSGREVFGTTRSRGSGDRLIQHKETTNGKG